MGFNSIIDLRLVFFLYGIDYFQMIVQIDRMETFGNKRSWLTLKGFSKHLGFEFYILLLLDSGSNLLKSFELFLEVENGVSGFEYFDVFFDEFFVEFFLLFGLCFEEFKQLMVLLKVGLLVWLYFFSDDILLIFWLLILFLQNALLLFFLMLQSK